MQKLIATIRNWTVNNWAVNNWTIINRAIINWIFPYKCMFCQQPGINLNAFICTNCMREIIFFNEPLCKQCGKILDVNYSEKCTDCENNPKYFSCARSWIGYQPCTKPLIYCLKNRNDTLLFKKCAELMYKRYSELILQADLIVPVPSHWVRRLRRGYNLPDSLAYYLSKLSGIPYCRVLKKTRYSGHQKTKTQSERVLNVQNSFKVKNSDKVNGKRIIVLDDVYATGSTVNECAKELVNSGAIDVIVLTIAKTLYK